MKKAKMVKATAEAHIQIQGSQKSVFFGSITTKCKDEVKSKTPSIKRWLFSSKGRRKDKDTALSTPEENKPYLDEQCIRERIIDHELHTLVQLPHGLDLNEWLATHTIALFEHVNLIYGTVVDYCTTTICTSMSAPGNVQYQWVDEKGKKLKCTAPQYVEYVMLYTQNHIDDQSVFPTKYGIPFPTCFEATVRKINRWLFHVLAHLFQSHYREILALSLGPHLNTIFLHFMCFNKTFGLLEEKEYEVLADLYDKMATFTAGQKRLSVAEGSVAPSDGGVQHRDCQSQTTESPPGGAEENKENVAVDLPPAAADS